MFREMDSAMDFDMQAFVKVVDKGTFAAAAEELGLTSSAMSKLVSRLEDRLGVRLLHRTTRRLALTPEGEIFLARSREIIEDICEAEAEVSRAGRRPQGRLRVNCTSGFAFHQLARVMPRFLASYPELRVELSVTDRVVDLLAENADVGLRSGEVIAPTLVVRRITHFERRLYASPAYLASHGEPTNPSDLIAKHACVAHATQGTVRWPFIVDGHRRELEIQSRLVVDNAEAALCLALSGAGIARVAEMMAAQSVRDGLLVPVLAGFHSNEPVVFSAVYPQGRHRMPKVRAFLDFLGEQFARADWLDAAPHS